MQWSGLPLKAYPAVISITGRRSLLWRGRNGSMSLDFRGKLAVVTGGMHGIGRSIADRLAEGGADVWIFDREAEGANTKRVDVTDREALETAFDEVGPPDIVSANAGTVVPEPLAETTRALRALEVRTP